MIRSLIWKEWREQRWKLVLGAVALGTFTWIGLRTRLVQDSGILLMSAVFGGLGLAVFVAMDLVAAERADGSLGALLKLPVRPWKVLLVKLGVGAVVCAAPLAVVATIICLVAGGRETAVSETLRISAGAIALTLITLVWTTAFGIRQPSEERTGLVGGVIVIVWWVAMAAVTVCRSVVPEWIGAFVPLRVFAFIDSKDAHLQLAVVVIQSALVVLLFLWAARRLAQPGRSRI